MHASWYVCSNDIIIVTYHWGARSALLAIWTTHVSCCTPPRLPTYIGLLSFWTVFSSIGASYFLWHIGKVPATMAKVFDFQWQIVVPESLLRGAVFDRFDEVHFYPDADESLFVGCYVWFFCMVSVLSALPSCPRVQLSEYLYRSIMPMTHAPETGTENPYQKTCTSFLQVCHANRYRFFLVPKSGTE